MGRLNCNLQIDWDRILSIQQQNNPFGEVIIKKKSFEM